MAISKSGRFVVKSGRFFWDKSGRFAVTMFLVTSKGDISVRAQEAQGKSGSVDKITQLAKLALLFGSMKKGTKVLNTLMNGHEDAKKHRKAYDKTCKQLIASLTGSTVTVEVTEGKNGAKLAQITKVKGSLTGWKIKDKPEDML